ncbi:MAG: hypothetical protein IJS46_06775, partial [Kiritimatiellae bacterium]|nr:hypothetical protein [Kiritimatiellia bacterium]
MPARKPAADHDLPDPAPIRPRRMGAGVRAFIAMALAAAVLVAANALSQRLWVRHAFVHHLPGVVADEIREKVSSLSGEARIVAFFEHSSPLRKSARRMLAEFRDIARRNPNLALEVETVDVNRDLARAAALKAKWMVEANSVLVVGGGRGIVLRQMDITYPSARDGSPVFAGDEPCADALASLLASDSRSSFSFVRTHGEVESAGRGLLESSLARVFSACGHETSLGPAVGLGLPPPGDGTVVVCDNPTGAFSEADCAETIRFVRSGGRILICAGPDGAQALKSLWAHCGITPVLPVAAHGNAASVPTPLKSALSGDHPVAESLPRTKLLFSDPVRFAVGSGENGAQVPGAPRVDVLAAVRRRDLPKRTDNGTALCLALEWRDTLSGGRPGRMCVLGDG